MRRDVPAAAGVSRRAEDTQLDDGKPVSGAWVVGDNPRLLFFPHIKPQTRYVVRVQAGLAAKGGRNSPPSSASQSTPRQSRRPSISPAAAWSLPAVQNGEHLVTTVNVPEVDIQFLKVRPEQLPRFLDLVVAGAPRARRRRTTRVKAPTAGRTELRDAVGNWQLDQLHSMTSAFVGRFLTEQKANRRAVTFIPVESIAALKSPGVYVAVMSQPNRFRHEYQTTYFYVSDLGLHLRQYAGKGAVPSSVR